MSRDTRSYSEKLRDPRWQRRRLTILERDGWECQSCGNDSDSLHVHHRWYERRVEPWDAPDEALTTLCASCHGLEYECRDEAAAQLLVAVRRHLLSHEIEWLASLFDGMPTEVVKGLAGWCVRADCTLPAEEWLRGEREGFEQWLAVVDG